MEAKLLEYMQNLDFPAQAQATLLPYHRALEALPEACAQIDAQIYSLVKGRGPVSVEVIDAVAKLIHAHQYEMHMLFLLRAAISTREEYRIHGLDEALFWDAMRDLLYKLHECKTNEGVYGTATFGWHLDFFRLKRFTLGRLQYEEIPFRYDRYQRHGVTVYAGDTVLNTHIPSSGPLTRELRLDSYRRAYEFYGCAEKGTALVVHCASWLLHPDNRLFYPAHSNILDFMDDFDLLIGFSQETFSDAWRVFGPAHKLPLAEWPTDSSLQRAYVDWFKAGRRTGYGIGILVFDGEKLLSGARVGAQ